MLPSNRATPSVHSRASPPSRGQARDPACSSVLGTTPAAVVPAQAGTHNHQSFGHRWSCHIALLRRMGPRLRGDDRGESLLHIFVSGDEGPSPALDVTMRRLNDLHQVKML